MKILVMGGTEFVSSSVAKYFISKGYIVDIFTRGIKSVKYNGFRNHFKGNRQSIEDLKSNIKEEKYDYVFDISAYTKEDVEKLLLVLNKNSIKRYIFCSSGAVYKPTEEIITEEFARGENENWGDYGINKKEAEDYLMNLYREDNLPITIFRPTYIYGEGNNLYREIYLFDRITKGFDIPIPKGDTKTQFIYIRDLVRVFESAMHIDKTIGQAYNVTHSEKVTWEHLVEMAMKIVDKKVNIKKVDNKKVNISAREYFPFRDVTYLLDIKKAENDGLYIPQINLQEGLERAYKWYCETRPDVEDSKMNKISYVLKV